MSKKHPLLQNEIDQERQLRAQLAAAEAERDAALAEAALLRNAIIEEGGFEDCDCDGCKDALKRWNSEHPHAAAAARVLQAAEEQTNNRAAYDAKVETGLYVSHPEAERLWTIYELSCSATVAAVEALHALAQPETEPSAPAAPVSTT